MAIPQQIEIKILPFRLNGRIGERIGFPLSIFKGLAQAFQIKYVDEWVNRHLAAEVG
jgi:hypothetical protein